MKNKIAAKLSLYFTASLLIFASIIGVIFIVLFKDHTVNLHKNTLISRAESIASALSGYMDESNTGGCCNMSGYGAYLRFVGDIAGADVWIVDSGLNLVTSGMRHGLAAKEGYNYSDLPENAESLINEIFSNKTVVGQDFSGIFSEPTLTVGAPAINGAGAVIGAVLLHSPVNGINEAVLEGVKLLTISLSIALMASVLLSLLLSKNFTDPIISKEAEDALKLENIRREFVANISHELKTPITVIRGSLEALLDEVVTDPVQVTAYHSQMRQEAVFLQRLVGDLLDLSKLQNSDFAMEKQAVSINSVIKDIVRSAEHIADKKGIKINVSQASGDCVIYGDYGRIRQMLMIILDNAVKFSSENGNVNIELKNKTLSVRDYGCGISESELPFIFDRFYKSRCELNKTGTGLGLAIAKQIAIRHDIKLSAQNTEEGGAIFILKLPLKNINLP